MKRWQIMFLVIVVQVAFFASGCARHKAPLEKPSTLPKMKGVYHVWRDTRPSTGFVKPWS
jgi:hypothetical protein